MKIAVKVLSMVLGLILVIFGANKFGHFITMPPYEAGSQAANYMGGLFGSPYFAPLLGLTEIVCGILIILNKYVPLALVILAPVALNMALFHATMDPAGGIAAYLVLGITIFLIVKNKEKFEGL